MNYEEIDLSGYDYDEQTVVTFDSRSKWTDGVHTQTITTIRNGKTVSVSELTYTVENGKFVHATYASNTLSRYCDYKSVWPYVYNESAGCLVNASRAIAANKRNFDRISWN